MSEDEWPEEDDYWDEEEDWGGPLTGKYIAISRRRGVAFYIDGDNYQGQIKCHMVGDDREFIFDVDDIIELEANSFCLDCGQVGCTWHIEDDL